MNKIFAIAAAAMIVSAPAVIDKVSGGSAHAGIARPTQQAQLDTRDLNAPACRTIYRQERALDGSQVVRSSQRCG